MTENLIMRPYRKGDEYGIVKLFKELFGREMTLEEWRWKYKKPGERRVFAFVCEAGDAIVGHYGGVPLRMIKNGTEIKVLAVCDVMVHPAYRGIKRLKDFTFFSRDDCIRDGVLLFYGFPTEKTLMIPAEKLGIYERIEDVNEASKDVSFSNNLSRFRYKFFPLDFEDGRIDGLWEITKGGLKLSVIRDRAYLRWRYKEHPLFPYEMWGMKKRWSDELLSLAVLRRQDDKILVMDMLFKDGALPHLMSKVENLVYRTGGKKLSLWLPSGFNKILKEMGFNISPAGASVTHTPHPLTINIKELREKLFYTMGDTDYL